MFIREGWSAVTETQALHSMRVLVGGGLEERWVVIEGGHIADVSCEKPDDIATLEFGTDIIAPGFIDTHIHGYAGADVLTCDAEDLIRMGKALALQGTTSWYATFPTASVEEFDAACAKVAKAAELGCPGLRGIFLEGPFLGPYRAGAHKREYLIDPSLELVDRWQGLAGGLIRKIAVAPELDGAMEFIRGCVARGIVLAIGHTEATYDEATEALDAGASVFVHTYNAMSGPHHRAPGVVGAALTCDGTYCELIADESHVNRVAADMLLRCRKWQEVALITDCLAAAGTPDGMGTLGEMPVVAHGNVCHLTGGHMLAGTTLVLREVVRNISSWGITDAEHALRMASEVPAHSMRLSAKYGSIKTGAVADLVVLDGNLDLVASFQDGRRLV